MYYTYLPMLDYGNICQTLFSSTISQTHVEMMFPNVCDNCLANIYNLKLIKLLYCFVFLQVYYNYNTYTIYLHHIWQTFGKHLLNNFIPANCWIYIGSFTTHTLYFIHMCPQFTSERTLVTICEIVVKSQWVTIWLKHSKMDLHGQNWKSSILEIR